MDTDITILEAALDQFAATGVRRTSTDDIARRAGVNRATIYRRFGSREQLLASAYLHEAGRVLEQLTQRVPDVPESPDDADGFDPAENVVAMFSEAVLLMRGHQLLQRMIEADREQVLAAMTVGAADILAFAADVLSLRIRELHRWRGTEPPTAITDVAFTIARLIQSLVLTPGGGPQLDTRADLARYARAVVVPMVLGQSLP